MALCEAHPDLVGAVRLNPDLPGPGAAGPLRAARRALASRARRVVAPAGGAECRPSAEGLRAACAPLPPELRARSHLAVAGRMADASRNPLRVAAARPGIASRLYLPGYVSD